MSEKLDAQETPQDASCQAKKGRVVQAPQTCLIRECAVRESCGRVETPRLNSPTACAPQEFLGSFIQLHLGRSNCSLIPLSKRSYTATCSSSALNYARNTQPSGPIHLSSPPLYLQELPALRVRVVACTTSIVSLHHLNPAIQRDLASRKPNLRPPLRSAPRRNPPPIPPIPPIPP